MLEMATLPARLLSLIKQALLLLGQSWRQINSHLLIANARQVPDHEPPVSPTGGQDGLILGTPPYLEHLLIVVFKHMQVLLDHPQIVQSHLQDRVWEEAACWYRST